MLRWFKNAECPAQVRRSARMVAILAVASAVSLIAFEASAKTYKWVDDEGNVHYTQTPPPTNAKKSTQMSVSLEKVVKVHKRGRRLYCGDRSLPQSRSRNASTEIANLEQNIPDWRANIKRIKEQRATFVKRNAGRIRRPSFQQNMSKFDQKIAEAKCAIAWAEERLDALDSERGEIVKYHQDLQAAYNEVLRRKEINCGTDNRKGVITVDDNYREHRSCIKPYDRELKKLKRQIKNAKREADLVQR